MKLLVKMKLFLKTIYMSSLVGIFLMIGFCNLIGIAQSVKSIAPATAKSKSKVKLPNGFKSQFAEVNGQRIHYVTGGKGEPLLLLHGFPESWYTWRKIIPLLEKDFTLIMPDARGVGDSSCPAKGYSKVEIAEDFYQLMQKLGYKQFYLAGHDWGGVEAVALAATHPESVRKLINLEAGALGSWLPNRDLLWFFGLMRQPDNFAEKIIEGRQREFFTWFWTNKDGNRIPNAIDAAAQEEYMRTFGTTCGMKAGFERYRTLDKDFADTDRFAKTPLTMPVLAVGAEFSFKDQVAWSMRHVAKDVTQVIVPNSGHFVLEEQPEFTAKTIRDFLKNNAPRQSGTNPNAEQSVQDFTKRWNEMYAAKDLSGMIGLYAADTMWLPPNEPRSVGTEKVRETFSRFFQAPNSSLVRMPEKIVISKSGEFANVIGGFEFSADTPQGRFINKGKYVSLLAKVDGGWKIAADIYSGDSTASYNNPNVSILRKRRQW